MPFTYKHTEAYLGQLFNPATFQPLEDQILVLPDEAPAMRGILHIPENARIERNERGYEAYYRTGVVIKVGPGDRAIEFYCADCHELYNSTVPRYRHIASCPNCGSPRRAMIPRVFQDGVCETRRPMELKPGDHILYLVRPGSEVMFEGKEYMILHEDAETGQHVLGILED